MPSSAITSKDLEAYSVESLLEAVENDWKLSVAQRAFEWRPQQIVNLIDSILQGFPIGTILVGTYEGQYYEPEAGPRQTKTADGGVEQILDGQQRVMAMRATLDPRGHFPSEKKERLWIQLGQWNERREFHRERGTRWRFAWTEHEKLNGLSRKQRLELGLDGALPDSGWLRVSDLRRALDGGVAWIAEHASLPAAGRPIAAKTLELFDAAWHRPRIPIYRIDQRTVEPEDVFQVFVRLNTGGTPLRPADVFFAGAKKYWRNAEEHVFRMQEAAHPLLMRHHVITTLGRLGAKDLGKADPVRVSVEYLSRFRDENDPEQKKNLLTTRMNELTDLGSDSRGLLRATEWVKECVVEHFGYGAPSVNKQALVAAIGWAWKRADEGHLLPAFGDVAEVRPLLNFLFYASLLGSGRASRTSYPRHSLRLAMAWGERGRPFPAFDDEFQARTYAYTRVQASLPLPGSIDVSMVRDDDGSLPPDVSNWLSVSGWWNHLLILGACQRARIDPDVGYDVDHIFAQNQARKLRRALRGQELAELDLGWAGRIGNLALISLSANRKFGDCPPAQKFESADGDDYSHRDYLGTDPFLSAEEREGFERAYEQMAQNPRECALLLKRVVLARSIRIWNWLVGRFGPPPTAPIE